MKKTLKKGLSVKPIKTKKEAPKVIDFSAVQTVYLKRNKNWVLKEKTQINFADYKVESYIEAAKTIFISKV